MPERSTFTISYAPETYKHLDWIEVKYHRLVATTIEEQLSHTPAAETRNRKPRVFSAQRRGIEWTSSERPPSISRAFHGKSENLRSGSARGPMSNTST